MSWTQEDTVSARKFFNPQFLMELEKRSMELVSAEYEGKTTTEDRANLGSEIVGMQKTIKAIREMTEDQPEEEKVGSPMHEEDLD